MIGRLSLRLAAFFSLALTVLHTIGFTKPGPDSAQATVRRAMESTAFNLGGSIRTYWDVYLGFGLSISALLLGQTLVLWLLARADAQRPGENRGIIAAMLLGNVLMIVVSTRYLFVAPVISTGLITIPLAVALVTVGRGSASAGAPQAAAIRS
jgi:hypothetical protein